jgi:CheY-like chemotaxis protein
MPKILVVDDNDTLRTAISLTLEEMGCEVSQAGNGSEALVMQQSRPAEVLLTDLIMPEKEGIEVIQEFRRRYPEVTIIAMSAGGRMSARDLLKMANNLGASYTLTKPFSKDQLAETMMKVLAGSMS